MKLLGYADAAELLGRPVLDLIDPVSHDVVRTRMARTYDPNATDLMSAGSGRVTVRVSSPR